MKRHAGIPPGRRARGIPASRREVSGESPAPRSTLREEDMREYLFAMAAVIAVVALAFWMGFGGGR